MILYYTICSLLGFDKIRKARNSTIEAYDAGSARYERNAAKDQKKWLAELDENFVDVEEEENSQISTMVLPGRTRQEARTDIICR